MADSKNGDLIRLEPVLEIVRTALWTGYVSDDKPVSLVLIAAQESAKSQALKRFDGSRGIITFSDITSKGIETLKSQIESGELHHIVIMDLIRIVSHGRFVSDRTIQVLAGLMEEGEASKADAGGTSKWNGMPNCGVLMSITPQFYRSKRGRWRDTGFLTRFLPVFFHYSEPTKIEIHNRISAGMKLTSSESISFPEKKQEIQLSQQQAKIIEKWAIDWGLSNETWGFRHHRQLRSLVKARALSKGRRNVSEKDMQDIYSWRSFFSTHQPHVI